MISNLHSNNPIRGGNFGGHQINIVSLLLVESGTYGGQFRRPFVADVRTDSLMQFQNAVERAGDNLKPSALAGGAFNFIRPSTEPEKQIQVVNGWGNSRICFMMEVEIVYSVGGSVREIIQGYTDHPGVSFGGQVDPRMVFQINSVMLLRNHYENTPFGRQAFSNVIGANHVLPGKESNNIYDTQLDTRIRPPEIFYAMTHEMVNDTENILDTRLIQGRDPVFSKRNYCVPTNYVENVITSFQRAAVQAKTSDNFENLLTDSADISGNDQISLDGFIKVLSKLQDRIGATDFFTYENLVRLDPTVGSRTHIVRKGEISRINRNNLQEGALGISMHNAGSTADWNDRSIQTITATILSNSVPAIMMECGFTGMYMIAHNRNTINGQPDIFFSNLESFSKADMSNYARILKDRIFLEVLNDVSSSNLIDFYIEMNCNLLGETWIRVSIGSPEEYDYVVPSFADALMVPVMTSNRAVLNNMTQSFDLMLNTVAPVDRFGIYDYDEADNPFNDLKVSLKPNIGDQSIQNLNLSNIKI